MYSEMTKLCLELKQLNGLLSLLKNKKIKYSIFYQLFSIVRKIKKRHSFFSSIDETDLQYT